MINHAHMRRRVMALKVGVVIMAPDGDPSKHRFSMKTYKLELVTVIVRLFDFDEATDVCKSLVKHEGVQVLFLGPCFSLQAAAG